MSYFKKTNAQAEVFTEFIEQLDGIAESLQLVITDIELRDLKQLKANFQAKTDDFFREDRKLNIGIIGQVKAGKSSFLNTMIFKGRDVLPRASTPKTATLTKIEYAEENAIEVVYYTPAEWEELTERAKVDSEQDEYRVAREILKFARENGIDVLSYLGKGTDTITFSTYDELMSELNHYVGENGRLTALVKYVTLKINDPQLQEISIVDTPGLNDPIASRTDKTKQFMELCDVVFFLSRASHFLDATDMNLLTAQLPQKGVNRLVLICSRYDDGLADTIFDHDSLENADRHTKAQLRSKARQSFKKQQERLATYGTHESLIHILEQCKEPLFVSSMAHNMSEKTTYASDEQLVFDALNEFSELTVDKLREIGNIDAVQSVFAQVIEQKEQTLSNKSASFIPVAKQELHEYIQQLHELYTNRYQKLERTDKAQLEKEQQATQLRIHEIQAVITSIFTELYNQLERSKTEGIQELRQASSEYASLKERTGTEQVEHSVTVSTSKWYNPFSWGSSSTEYYTTESRYYYLDIADALENIRHFENDAVHMIEQAFYDAVDIHQLKRRLLKTVIENIDTAASGYDPSYFKLMTEKTVQDIELPVIKLDISDYLQRMSANFSGEVRDASNKSEMRMKLSATISKVFDVLIDQFTLEIKSFKNKLSELDAYFTDKLLENITAEYTLLLEKMDNQRIELMRFEKTIVQLERISKEAKRD